MQFSPFFSLFYFDFDFIILKIKICLYKIELKYVLSQFNLLFNKKLYIDEHLFLFYINFIQNFI